MLIMLSAFSQNNSVRRVKAINVNDKRYVFEYGNIPGNNKPVAFLGTQGNKRFLGTVVNDGEEILYMINSAERSGNISAGVPNTDIMNDINLTTLTLFDKEPVIIQDTYLYFPAEGFCQVKSRVRSFWTKRRLKKQTTRNRSSRHLNGVPITTLHNGQAKILHPDEAIII